MIGQAEPLGAVVKSGMRVKAVKYGCGCVREREKAVAIVTYWQRCPTHTYRMTGFWRK